MTGIANPLRAPVLRALGGAGNRTMTAENILDAVNAAGWPQEAPVSEDAVVLTVRELTRGGFVSPANVAHFFRHGERPPDGERRWAITDSGRAELAAFDSRR